MTHYVFWQEKREGAKWYKFYGVFQFDQGATLLAQNSEQPHIVYAREGKSAPCLKVEEKAQVFTDDEFKAMVGHVVRVKFLDKITFSADCGTMFQGEVKVWPEMNLVVKDVTGNCLHAICGTEDEKLLESAMQHIPAKIRKNFRKIQGFSIPRQDFSLGYVEALPYNMEIGEQAP